MSPVLTAVLAVRNNHKLKVLQEIKELMTSLLRLQLVQNNRNTPHTDSIVRLNCMFLINWQLGV